MKHDTTDISFSVTTKSCNRCKAYLLSHLCNKPKNLQTKKNNKIALPLTVRYQAYSRQRAKKKYRGNQHPYPHYYIQTNTDTTTKEKKDERQSQGQNTTKYTGINKKDTETKQG
jgi:hypothetical protein